MTTADITTTTDFVLVNADPYDLDVAANVRDEVTFTDDDPFVDSIAQHGVLQAISAVRRADGTLAVIDGQRRTLGARAAGVTVIPVLVRRETEQEKAATIERITAQLIANEHRTDITERQRAAAVTTLIDLGMSVPVVAKTLRFRRDYVEVAAVAGRSVNARRNFDELQLSLDDAATVAELETAAETDPQITDELNAVFAHTHGINWRLRTLVRTVAERADQRAAATDQLARGIAFLADDPATGDGEWFSIADLRTADGVPVHLDVIDQAPHLWHVHPTEAGYITVDAATGEEVDDTEIDENTIDDEDAEAAEGLRHADSVTEKRVWHFEYFITDAHRIEAGLQPSPELAALTAAETDDEDGLTPAQRAAARAEAARLEDERAERRKVKALNRAGATATELRRSFLTGLLASKSAPKNATKWMIAVLAVHGDVFTESKCAERYAEIMNTPLNSAADKAENVAAARAEVLLLARVLTAFEARLTGPQDAKDYWRFSAKHYRGMVGIDSYLTFLADSGHTLTPVEQAAIGNITVDAAYDAVTDD